MLPLRIIFTGCRASGKSSVGRLVALRLGWPFVDTDRVLEEEAGKSISEIVAAAGWDSFRLMERRLLERLTTSRNLVIATGGGAILHQKEWLLLRRGALAVWLKAPLSTISQRLRQDPASASGRPSLTGQTADEELALVLARREPLYRQGSDLALDTGRLTAEEAARAVIDAIPDPFATVTETVADSLHGHDSNPKNP